ncbi:threonine--tRNA ligase [Candidatus Nomurabacteria bacterium CG1_02_43_90]|uniref:Threonine--tRNA ligase n=1 Tax=Candidatus Nomurabacteria bacterium CG1_02_43_90 TaxID=1805281 RepID=A0A1J4V6X4_9BACT|nr:MAG: threonine--tRNA ligase [Candidatus Nomurabacteria bacterium CG1_02_43_90]
MEQTEKLHNLRHSLAHLLAIAVIEKDPGVKLAIGPVIDNGFYYDFEFSNGYTPTPEDLKNFEKAMRKMVNKGLPFKGREVSTENAKKLFVDQPYKTELINEFASGGKKLTLYTTGTFTDLCRGGHVENTKEIPADCFTITHTAGAYWRGDEKNPMLTRIYGLAFESSEALDAYKLQQEEAKKRDHRKLGKELGLFTFSELVGPGLPLWTPKGTMIRELLNDYVWELRKKQGFQKVTIPHITKKDLYETSGHWKKFADELFKIETREGHLYAMKPMNCPHHTQIFACEQRSYRNMPQRYCETTMVYRDEQSGELSGLSRVLSITQDDAHVFCRENQIEREVFAIWDIIDTFYKTFGFENLQVRFSRHDPETFEKYLGTKEVWEKAESAILALLKKRGIENYIDGKGEAAMYGPKIDFMSKDAIGRTLQVATIQLDFNQPKNFDLVCMNEQGGKEQVVMIHCAIMGSIERFMSTLIEHTAGAFPLWLSPVQVKILPISEKYIEYAKKVQSELLQADIRVEMDDSNESLGKRIRIAKMEKTPFILVIGEKEVEAGTVTVEMRGAEKGLPASVSSLNNEITERKQAGETHPLQDFINFALNDIKEKKIW